jgi:hypothetical protein
MAQVVKANFQIRCHAAAISSQLPDRDVINTKVPVYHDPFQLSEAERIPERPADAQDNDLGFKMVSPELRCPVPSHTGQSLHGSGAPAESSITM